MSNYVVEYFHPGESYTENGKEYVTKPQWRQTYNPALPGPHKSEAERLAARRSENGRVYRVRTGKKVVSKFQNGQQLAKEDM